jgi:hypothetical protein
MRILKHPGIWKFSVVVLVINMIALIACINSGNAEGILINSLCLVVNGFGALGNYMMREYRRVEQEQQNELHRLEERQKLINKLYPNAE